VDRVVYCLLALESLQLFMNPLQYAMFRMKMFNTENRWVISSGGCEHARRTFVISNLCVGVLNSVLVHLDGCCVSHCGPFHHSVDFDSVVCSIPLEMRSAELD